MMDRRQILFGISALMGGSLLPSSVRALERSLASGAEAPLTLLSGVQLQAVTTIGDIILPATETPGASGAGVPAFIDRALAGWLLKEETDAFLAGLDQFLKGNPGFLGAGPSTQEAVIQGIDSQLEDLPKDVGFYRQLKELVLIGYYTSEVGATEELEYDPVPGGYRVFDMTEETKAWST